MARRRSTRTSQRKRAKAANATINRELSIIRRAFTLASKTHPPKVKHIPLVAKLPEDNIRTGFIEQEQYEALRQHLTRALTPLVIGYHPGLQRGAILRLEWSMVDLKNEELRIPPKLAKNKTGQACPLFGELLAHLKALEQATPKGCRWVCHDKGERIIDFRGEWEAATAAANPPVLLFHDLRRSAKT